MNEHPDLPSALLPQCAGKNDSKKLKGRKRGAKTSSESKTHQTCVKFIFYTLSNKGRREKTSTFEPEQAFYHGKIKINLPTDIAILIFVVSSLHCPKLSFTHVHLFQ